MKGTVFCWDLHLPFERALAWSSFSRAPRKARTFHRRQTSNKRTQQIYTPPKFNMEPKNEGLEDVFPFQMGDC